MTLETEIDRICLKTLFNALALPETTGYRYLKTLDSLLSGQEFWTYQKGDGSLDRDGIAIINIYFELTREHKIQFCKKQLTKELEKYGYQITQNHRTSNRTNYTKGTGNNEQSNFYDSLLGI